MLVLNGRQDQEPETAPRLREKSNCVAVPRPLAVALDAVRGVNGIEHDGIRIGASLCTVDRALDVILFLYREVIKAHSLAPTRRGR